MKRWGALIVILTFLAVSCGGSIFEGLEDKSSQEARRLEVAKLLDEGNYDAVLSYPGVSPLDYAAAAMGKAGLDTTNLLNSLIDMAQSTSTNDLSPVTEFFPLNPDALPYLEEAKRRLGDALTSDPFDEDLNFQMTILCLTDVVVELGRAIEEYGVGTPRDGISPAEAGNLADAILNDSTPNYDEIDILRISDDVVGIAFDYLPDAGLGINSDLRQTIDSVSATIRGYDNNPDDVSTTDVVMYLQQILSN
ncbi:MAG: hypothetical protein D6713_00880 [Deltaproteobacteria bacterium]|nr:MAG: hypothetical protein D6713_00880 [Deltaproteobacteria bacterium]